MAFLEEYTLLSELGKGGFATVYKVRHNELGYIRAVRVLNDTIQNKSDKAYQNFLRECKMLLVLGNGNHRGIVHIYKPDFLANKAIVEMDYVDGMDLSHYLADKDYCLPVDEVIRMVAEMSSALAYCHEDIYKFRMDRDADGLKPDPIDGSKLLIDDATRQHLIDKYKVIHNDIHSRNIMRRENGDFVLLDFGLAIDGEEVGVSSSRRKAGALEYLSPEKWADAKVLTTQSDIYSFGVVMYEYLTGRVPFRMDKDSFTAQQKLFNNVTGAPVPSIFEMRREAYEAKYPDRTYQKDYPDWLEEVILKCLEKDPAKRFCNGKELYEFVKKYIAEGNDVVAKSRVNRALRERDVIINNLQIEKINLENEKTSLTNQAVQLKDSNDLLQKENGNLKKMVDGYSKLKNAFDSLKGKKRVAITLCVLLAIVALAFSLLYFYSLSDENSSDSSFSKIEIDDLNKQVESLTAQLDADSLELKGKNNEIADLNRRLNELKEAKPDEVKDLQKQIDDMEAQLKSKQTEIDDLKVQQKKTLTANLQEIANLNNQVKAKQNEISNLNTKIANLEKKVSAGSDNSAEIKRLNEQLSAKQNEISNLKTKIANLEKKITTGSDNSTEINRLNEQLSAKQSEISNLKTKIANLEKKISTGSDNSAEINRLNSQLAKRQDEINRLKSDSTEQQRVIKVLKDQIKNSSK